MPEPLQLVVRRRIVANMIEKLERPIDAFVPAPALAVPAPAIILRLEDLPSTPQNLERIREKVRQLNERLAESGTPFQLRLV